MQGKKTHEQQTAASDTRKQGGAPDARRPQAPGEQPHIPALDKRESEFPVSRGGVHQESDHNKHNDAGQQGHKPQQHTPAEEKH